MLQWTNFRGPDAGAHHYLATHDITKLYRASRRVGDVFK